ncbi:hypothetical protein [Streptomyces sp. SID13031]|uniref:hypothetical protein n=1 Tax=Streptomyces sp. SID13031 TaxID=2706046 RepID=UPI0013C92F1B|nr:hypothetical protein [Streptomyces sp. SID13031]NEA37299.1 hypothetical protein [Streptomyces sp. SID13031]
MDRSVLIRYGLVLVAAVAVFMTGMVVQHHAGGSDGYAGCGAGAPDWAQQSVEACATFEAQGVTDDQGGDTSGSNQQQYDQQERMRQLQAEERARQQQEQDNYNCQVGPMFCPR